MHLEISQGSVLDIQGLKCHIPPEGYVYNIVTKQLEYRGVYSRSEKKEEQYWERFKLPDWYKSVIKAEDNYEKKRKDDDSPFYDDRYEQYKKIEWDRRLNGFWYMNNGTPTFLVGLHYLFLQWVSIDIGYPRFRIIDLEYFYFLQYCIEDPLCMGMVEICKRRNGKTFRAGVFLLDYITRTKMTNGGIQSKTGTDAKKVFGKAVINPFKRLPKFFRPEYDMSLGITPKTEIRFQQTNVRGKKAEEGLDRDELGSMIDHQSADPLAYDGQKLHRHFNDEFCKTIECNIHDRHETLRYCIMDEEGEIIGKLLYSSTVEIMDTDRDGVQEGAKLLWDESDQLNRQENGKTVSGLYRFFMTADRSKFFDIYGFPDVDKVINDILLDRESVKNNIRALSARKRKEPRTIQEAFSTDGDKCIFNVLNIDKRDEELKEEPVYKRQIMFERGLDGLVYWRDIKDSEKDFHWKITQLPPTGQENKYDPTESFKKPGRTKEGAITVDGYSNSQGGRKYGSKASAWIGRKHDLLDEKNSFKAIGHLYGRPTEKDDLHNQCLLAAEYYGFQVWYEHNSDDYDSYFKNRQRKLYLGIYPLSTIDPTKREEADRHRGFPTTPFSLTKQNDVGIAYFEKYCHLIDYPDLLENAKKFDPYERTKFDAVVSFLMLLVCLMEPVYKPPPPKDPLIRTYGDARSGRQTNPAMADY